MSKATTLGWTKGGKGNLRHQSKHFKLCLDDHIASHPDGIRQMGEKERCMQNAVVVVSSQERERELRPILEWRGDDVHPSTL